MAHPNQHWVLIGIQGLTHLGSWFFTYKGKGLTILGMLLTVLDDSISRIGVVLESLKLEKVQLSVFVLC